MTQRPTATLTEEQVVYVLQQLAKPYPERPLQRDLAKELHVSTKTINRINVGDTWKEFSSPGTLERVIPKTLPAIVQVTHFPEAQLDLDDNAVAVKNHFGFAFSHPINWGWFENWEGVHHIASDGIISWESSALVHFAQKLAQSEINASPILAGLAEELPTFELEDLMTHPIGGVLAFDLDLGGLIKLLQPPRKYVYLQQSYYSIAQKLKLEIRQALDSEDNFVYLVKSRYQEGKEPSHNIVACVATMA